MRIPGIEPELQRAAETIIRAGFKAFLVGGAVRDRFLGRMTSDYDIATDATPDQCLRLFPHAIPTGVKHGTITVIPRSRRFKIEITTFRIESDYRDGRHPDSVTFVDDITQDLSRRDFTINAMAIDLENGTFVDPFGGRADIAARLVKAVGNPTARFQEDGLRTLRAIRFAAQLEFSIDPATLDAVAECRDRLACISSERIRDEFSKMICSPVPSRALRLLVDTQTILYIIPELLECVDVRQPER
ncbi:MAG: polynucleotide adenylyltransferase, partial [Spirochaetales bacterium]|nr:polynucleotide adenylyltransferase [Spirochaetales bacterium]